MLADPARERKFSRMLKFIPLAEETGLIISMGRWVLRRACHQLRSWREQGVGALRVSVNVSPREFRAPGFLESLAGILEETQMRPGELELTERGVMQHDRKTFDVLREVKKMGVRLAVDDFGTGHTTFHYLKHFPLDTLKIDKSLTQGIASDVKDAAITKALLVMAHRLQLNVVAEGVETEAQMSFLGDHRCDEVQGYLFSRPLPAHELLDALERYVSATLGVVNVARTISGFENLARLSQVSEQRVVTFILLAMRIESSKQPIQPDCLPEPRCRPYLPSRRFRPNRSICSWTNTPFNSDRPLSRSPVNCFSQFTIVGRLGSLLNPQKRSSIGSSQTYCRCSRRRAPTSSIPTNTRTSRTLP